MAFENIHVSAKANFEDLSSINKYFVAAWLVGACPSLAMHMSKMLF